MDVRKRKRTAKAVRRLRGVVNAQASLIKTLRGQVQGLGGKVESLDSDLEAQRRDMQLVAAEKDGGLAECRARIRQLERVPRLLRWFFRAT